MSAHCPAGRAKVLTFYLFGKPTQSIRENVDRPDRRGMLHGYG